MEAYHLEALRKQRVLDRALEARDKLEKESLEEKQHHHHHHHHKRSRPTSAQASNIQSKKNRSRSATPQATATPLTNNHDGGVLLAAEEELSAPTLPLPQESRASTVNSKQGSYLSKEMADQQLEPDSRAMSAISSCPISTTNHTPAKTPTRGPFLSNSHTPSKSAASSRSQSRACSSHLTGSGRMSCTTCCSCNTSNCSECIRLGAHSRGSGSHTTTCSAAERRANEVRQDLKK